MLECGLMVVVVCKVDSSLMVRFRCCCDVGFEEKLLEA